MYIRPVLQSRNKFLVPAIVGPAGPQSWNPFLLGSVLIAWWDSSQGVSLSGSNVTAWADRKGGYSAVQGTGASQPLWSATSFNGAPGITFDGSDDELTLASVPFATSANTSEIYAVCQQDGLAADTGTRHVFSYGGTAGASRRALVRRVASGVNRGASEVGDGASGIVTTITGVDFSTRHLVGAIITGTTTSTFVDSSANTDTSTIPATGTTRTRIGSNNSNTAGNFWNGKIRDIVVTSALTTEQRTALKTFLLSRRNL